MLPLSDRRAGRRRRLAAVVTAASMAAAGLTAIAMPAQASTTGTATASSRSSSAASPASSLLSADQAAAKARSTGKAVIASALTTPYEQVTANPKGGYTLTQSATPSRALKNGAWVPLNSTLVRNSDGTLSPTTSTSTLRISDGGKGPLATLNANGEVMSLTLPVALPTPSVSGSEATYTNVIPGVDLTVTVADTGAFSDTLVVRSASAAADPRLKSLLSASVKLSRGLKESTDSAGDITVSAGKQSVFNAPTPYAWDSATASSSAATSQAAATVPATSSVSGPGRAAHFTRLGVTASATSTKLTAPTSLFSAKGARYPVYIDPWFTPSYGANGWASFGSGSSTAGTNRWDSTPDAAGDAFVGNTGDSDIGVVWSAFNFQLPDTGSSTSSNLVGATINSATFGIVADTSGSCSGYNETVNLYAPNAAGGNYLQKSNATYTHWSGASIGGVAATATFVGQKSGSTSCGGNGAGAFNVKSAVQSEVSSTRAGNQTFILRAADETDVPATKRFPVTLSSAGNPTLTVQFDKAPSAPTNLTLSTGHGCGSTLGDSSTQLESKATSPMNSELTTTFDLYKTSDGTQTNLLTSANGISSDQYTTASGQYSVMSLSESFLKTVSAGAATSFTWKADDTDGTLPTTGWSSTCTFTFDPTRPGAPSANFAANSSGYTCVTASAMTPTTAQPVGSTCAITLAPAPSTTGTISGYVYQVNQQSPVKVSATGSTTVTFTIPEIINTLTVNALSSGGNIGQETTVQFDGTKLNPPAVDGSVANDGEPDVIVPGGSGAAFPAGLWLTQTHADGSAGVTPVNIGTAGLGFGNTKIPAQEWDGSQVITGDFCGLGAQDVMAYFPTGANAGGGAIDCSDGSTDGLTQGSPLDGGSSLLVPGQTFQDADSANASSIANAYDTSGRNTGIPDIFTTSTQGLNLYTSTTANGYTNDSGLGLGNCIQDCDFLSSQLSPDDTSDWQNWTITSAQQANGQIDMYLWNASAGELVLWTDVTLNTSAAAYPNATSLTYNASILQNNGWNQDATDISLRAAVVAGQNTPTLWVTNTSNGQTSEYNSEPTQLGTVTHNFTFGDMPATAQQNAALTSTADVAGSLTLTGSTAGAAWHTGDAFSPDAMLNTSSDNETAQTSLDGSLTSNGPAVTLNQDFSVAFSVRPNALGGVMLSQSGTNTAGFTVGATSSGQWQFCLAKSDAAGPALDCATGGTEQLDVWSDVVATYSAESGNTALYVDGTQVAEGQHSKVSGFTGNFLVGDERTSSSAFGGYYSGQVADILTWASVAQPVAIFGAGSSFVPVTPFRMIDTRSGSQVGPTAGPIAPATSFSVKPGGVGGIPTTGVTAIAATITIPQVNEGGFVTVYPDGTPVPVTSTLEYSITQNVTNGVIAALGSDGEFDIYNSGVAIQVIVDVTGYFTTATGTTNAGTFTPVEAMRVFDTRNGTGGVPTAKITAGSKDVLTVAGEDSLPTTGLTAVAINLTITDGSQGANIEAYQDGLSATPLMTSVTTTANGTSSAMSIVPVGSDGKIDIYNAGLSGSSADVLGDVVGYFTKGTTGEFYHAVAPNRMVDTRQSGGALPENGITYYTETAVSANQPTIVANVTETGAATGGILSVYPMYDIDPPGTATSTIDYTAGSTIANLDLIDCNDAGYANDFQVENTTGSPQLIVDVTGFFAYF